MIRLENELSLRLIITLNAFVMYNAYAQAKLSYRYSHKWYLGVSGQYLRLEITVFPAAKPVVIFDTRRIPVASPKDKLPVTAQSKIIYHFECVCGSKYIGRTGRRLAVRIREHLPKWLESSTKAPPRSSQPASSAITRHLQTCRCTVSEAAGRFKVLFRARSDYHLRILESLSIKRFRPELCVQKDHVVALQLPW